ncbi:MAG TPA: alkaline phosphatase [Blastococcus sp.]|nr:alkaline phosphatase [Blastococcus sp.]
MRDVPTTSRSRRARLVPAAAVTAVVLSLGGAAAASADRRDGSQARARNVILFVGDGMGVSHRTAAALATVGPDGELAMDGLRHSGLVSTAPADPGTVVTDSAAAGTALATGVRTSNGAVGVDPDGRPVETVVERAEAAGLATGLVTTGEITDATTAAFAAHVPDRGQQTEIARQFVEETGVDVLLGGGEDFWYPPGDPGRIPGGTGLSDQGDLVRRAQELGYAYVSDRAGLAGARGDELLGLFDNRTMFVAAPEPAGTNDRRVSLAEMTQKAIDVLSRDDDGFLLVVEEEAVDGQAHANNAGETIEAVRLLDRAVAVGTRFAEGRDDTLVITTADHETGGMAVLDTGTPPTAADGPFDVAGSDLRFAVGWTTGGHTGADVPLTAEGPGAGRLGGHHGNTFVHRVVVETLFGAR